MAENAEHRLIGLRIEQRRKELGLTLQEVSLEVGVAASTIQRYEKGRFEKIKLPVIEAIAGALNVNPAWIIGSTDDPTDYNDPDLIASIPLSYIEACNGDIKSAYRAMQAFCDDVLQEAATEARSGRQAAEDEMRRAFGTKYSTLSTYLCEDKIKAAVLYYKAVDRRAAPEISGLITMVEDMDFRKLEKIRRLIAAYLKAGEPIREIIDTALKPYDEEENIGAQIG